jgi:peptide methionine sulfoxide reductase msrA/msrB
MKKILMVISILLILVIVLLINIDMNNEEEIIEEKRDYNIEDYETAIFAGGCFWCMEPPFEKLDGVIDAVSGYTGGSLENPTYEEVSSGSTEHIEAVKIVYNSEIISYEELLDVFWRQIDPTDAGGQFVDRGYQYTSAIFYSTKDEKKSAEESLKSLEASGRFDEEIVTPIREASVFYNAEEYHQDYYIKSDVKYKYYRSRSGRDAFLNKVWGSNE